MPNLYEEFRTVVATLGAARVPYAVCAGIAMSIHARPRATIDIDLLAPPAAFVGPRALECLRAGEANRLEPAELLIALGLAWAAGDLALVRAALATLPAEHVAADAALSAFRDAAR
jgi:hypothetical protein